MLLTHHYTALGGPALDAETLLRGLGVAVRHSGFVGQLREYDAAGAWVFADVDGDLLVPVAAAVSTATMAAVHVYSVRIEMEPGRAAVTWNLYPRSLVVRPTVEQPDWSPGEPVRERAHANGREDLEDQAARGIRLAEQIVARALGAGVIASEQRVAIPGGEPAAPAPRLDRRLADLARRMRDARSVVWEAVPNERLAVTIECSNGDRVRAVLARDDAAVLRAKVGR